MFNRRSLRIVYILALCLTIFTSAPATANAEKTKKKDVAKVQKVFELEKRIIRLETIEDVRKGTPSPSKLEAHHVEVNEKVNSINQRVDDWSDFLDKSIAGFGLLITVFLAIAGYLGRGYVVNWQEKKKNEIKELIDETQGILSEIRKYEIEVMEIRERMNALASSTPKSEEEATDNIYEFIESDDSEKLPVSVYREILKKLIENYNPSADVEKKLKAVGKMIEGEEVVEKRAAWYGKLTRIAEAYEVPLPAIHYFNYACHLGTLKKYEKAIEQNTKAINLKPEYVFTYNNRGAYHYRLKQYDAALADYKKALKRNPQHLITILNIAELNIQLLDFSEAEKVVVEKFSLYVDAEDKVRALYLLRLALAGKGEGYEGYTKEYNVIVKQDPSLEISWNYVAIDLFLKEQEGKGKVPADRLAKMKEIHEEFKKRFGI
jgi:tetratricopeptide (TPR) repeat protein